MLMLTQDAPAFWGMTITLTILNIIVVPMRFYRRRVAKQKLKFDDWLTIPALAVNIGMSIAIWIGISKHAVGYPTPPVNVKRTPLDQVDATISINQQVFFIIFSMFAVSLALSKSSILCFYHRVFCPNDLWQNTTTLSISFMIVIVVMFGIGMTIAHIFACGTHFNYWWATAGAKLRESCIDTQTLGYAQAISDFIIDVVIIAIPIIPVWRMHLSAKQKLGVIAVFLTAGVAVAASLIKMIWFLWENKTPWNPSFDQDELSASFLFWTIMETHVALIAACLPTLRKLFTGHTYIDSVLRSIRTTISLSSLQSGKASTNSEGHGYQSKSTDVKEIGDKGKSSNDPDKQVLSNIIVITSSEATWDEGSETDLKRWR